MKVGETWYGLGKSKPQFDKGATVAFGFYLKDGKWATVKGDVKLVEQAVAKTSTSQSSTKSSYQAKDDYWAAKEQYEREVVQPRITFLAAYERAVHFADIVERAKAVPGLDKAKPEARLEILSAFVFELTDDLVARANATNKATKKPAKVAAESAPADSAQVEGEGSWE